MSGRLIMDRVDIRLGHTGDNGVADRVEQVRVGMYLWTIVMRNRLFFAFWVLRPRQLRMVLRVLCVCLLCDQHIQAKEPGGVEAELWLTSGEKTSGQVVEIETEQLTLRIGEANQNVPVTEVWQVALAGPARRPPRPTYWLYLTNGDRWGIRSVKLTDEELEFRLTGDEQTHKLSIGSVTGIQPVRPGTSWRTDESEWLQLAGRREKSDLVILRNGDHQTGEISTLDDQGLTLSGSLGTKTLEWTGVSGLLLNPDLAEVPAPVPAGWTVLLSDESWLTVSSIRLIPQGKCQLQTIHNIEWSTSLDGIRWLSHWDSGTVPLSRLPIGSQKHQPLLGETFTTAIDRNVRGLPLRYNTVDDTVDRTKVRYPSVFPQGVGMSSGMTVQWKLDGNYRRLLCGLCLDTTACPAGHAVVKFIVNDQPPLTVSLRAGDPLIGPTTLDLTGVQTLTIETEYGENADVCDWINLLTPVLVR